MNNDEYVCSAANRTFNLDRPLLFRSGPLINRVHRNSPRFGHTSDINKLINGSKEEGKDYAKGVLAGAIALFCFVFVWMIVLLVFKCLGHQRVGFFSGQNVRRPKPPPPPPLLEKDKAEESPTAEEQNKASGQDGTEKAHLKEREGVAEDLLLIIPRSEIGDDNPQGDDSSSKAFTETPSVADTQVMANLSRDYSQKNTIEHDNKLQSEDSSSRPFPFDESLIPAAENSQVMVNDLIHDYSQKNTIEQAVVAPAAESSSPEEYEKQLLVWQKQAALREHRLRNIRIVAFLAGLGIVIFVIIMIVKGVQSLEHAVDESRKGMREGQRLAQDAIELIGNYITAQNETLVAARSFVGEVNGICPALHSELCKNLGSVDQICNFTGIPEEFVQVIEPVLATVENTVYGELRDMQEDLQEIYDTLSDADETTGSFGWAFIVAGAFAGILGLLDLFMMWGIVLAWRNKKSGEGCIGCTRRCLRGCLLIPAFVLCVFFCWVFSLVFVIGSTASSDFCHGTPDTKITAFLYEHDDEFSGSIVYDFALYYTSACLPENVPLDMNKKIDQILDVFTEIASFLASLSIGSAEFQEVCGTEPSAVDAVAVLLRRQLCVLGNLLFDVQDYFSCSNWYPLYSVVMHESVCTEGFEGFHYVALSQFCIVMFAMIMLTVRAAFYDIMDEEDAERERLSWVNKWRRCYACRCCSRDTHVGDDGAVMEGISA